MDVPFKYIIPRSLKDKAKGLGGRIRRVEGEEEIKTILQHELLVDGIIDLYNLHLLVLSLELLMADMLALEVAACEEADEEDDPEWDQ